MDEDSNGSRDSGRGESSFLSSSPSPSVDSFVGSVDGEGEGRGEIRGPDFSTPPPRLPSQKKTRPRVNKGPPPYVIWQANLQKSRLASSLLIESIAEPDEPSRRPDFVCVQEPYCYKGGPRVVPQHMDVFYATETPRACILV